MNRKTSLFLSALLFAFSINSFGMTQKEAIELFENSRLPEVHELFTEEKEDWVHFDTWHMVGMSFEDLDFGYYDEKAFGWFGACIDQSLEFGKKKNHLGKEVLVGSYGVFFNGGLNRHGFDCKATYPEKRAITLDQKTQSLVFIDQVINKFNIPPGNGQYAYFPSEMEYLASTYKYSCRLHEATKGLICKVELKMTPYADKNLFKGKNTKLLRKPHYELYHHAVTVKKRWEEEK